MTTAEMQNTITSIIDNEYGLSVFAVLNKDENLSMVRFIPDDLLKTRIGKALETTLRSGFLSEEAQVESSDNIDDNKKIFYEIVQDEEYDPFAFLDTYTDITASYCEQDLDYVLGFAFRLNINNTGIWLYQQVVYPQMIKRSKHLYAMLSKDNVYTVLDKDVLRIESKIDCLIIGKSVFTSKIDLMQKSFHFERFVRKEASATIQLIADMGLVDSPERFISLSDRKSLTNAKKLMKAKRSPVLRMEKEVLLDKLQTLPRYKGKLEIQNGKIRISNQKQAIEFLKMLNDSILKSELTETEYDSSIKTELPPLE